MSPRLSTRRDFPTSIYCRQPRMPPWPTYNATSLLHLVRAERRMRSLLLQVLAKERERLHLEDAHTVPAAQLNTSTTRH